MLIKKTIDTIKHFYYFLRDLVNSRDIVIELTKNDFKSRYLGSYLGLLWAFAQPLATIGILWFVFEFGFKSKPTGNYPFMLWLMAGMIPWFYLNDSISSATTSIVDKSFLVKKVVFRIGILPIIKILSALIIHVFFIAILFIMFAFYGYMPHLYTIQVLYYLFAAIILTLGLSWITSSLVVFLKDIGQIVGILLQFGFWLTPVFWQVTMLPEEYRSFITLNPFYYITEGYRDSLVNKVWFWEHGGLTIYFWCITGIIFIVGALIFRRLKPHFADVL
jgi:ABC-type polysaccharide/polyol phosphate export permease